MSLTLPDARIAIYTRFISSWGSTTPIAFDNENFNNTGNESWVRCSVRHIPSGADTIAPIGSRRYLRNGNAFIQIFTRSGEGTQEADRLAQQARDIFEGIRVGLVRFNDAQIVEIPSDGLWYNIVVEIAFEYDERK